MSGRNSSACEEVTSVSKTKARITLTVEEEICKGCGLCVAVCPRKVLGFAGAINKRGFHPAYLFDPEHCTGCAQCALMCPDACVKIVRSS